jgi:hypothetical protein
LEINGPDVGLVGELLNYRVNLTDNHGRVIPISDYPLLSRSSNVTLPDGSTLPFPFDSANLSQYSFVAPQHEQDSLTVFLTVTFDDLVAYKNVTIYRQPICLPTNGLDGIWVGELMTFSIAPSTCNAETIDVSGPSVWARTHHYGLVANSSVAGTHQVFVTLNCQGRILPVTTCILPVWEYYDLQLSLSTSTGHPYVGSYVIVTPTLNTSVGIRFPRHVQWTVAGPADSTPLFDGTIALHGYAHGIVNITATVDEPVDPANVVIPFDRRLVLLTPHLLLAAGTTFQLAVEEDLPATYESHDNAVSVTPTGLVSALSVGIATVIVRFKSQLAIVAINVTSPTALYVEQVGGTDVVTRLLDEDGQQYSGRNGSSTVFDVPVVNASVDLYTLSVTDGPTVVNGSVTAQDATRSHHALLGPEILPWAPAIQRGVAQDLQCRQDRPKWSSSNLEIADISAFGRLSANHPGEAVIACDAGITTSVIVFELVGLALDRINDGRYNVRPLLFSTINIPTNRELIFPADLMYQCLWDAIGCGDVIYDNGSCVLALQTPRLCPAVSTLNVTAISESLGLSVSGSALIVRNNPWGRTDIVVRLPYGNQTQISIFGNIKSKNVESADEPPKGIEWTIDDTRPDYLMLTLIATGGYNEKTTLTLLDTASQEKVRIYISPTGDFAGASKPVNPIELGLFYLSIILTVVLSGYIIKKLGARQLLPPLSPYRPHR